MIAKIAVRDMNGVYDYIIPEDMAHTAAEGMRVTVPFGSRTTEGIIVEFCEKSELSSLKSVKDILDKKPLCTKELIELAGWLRDTCFCSYYTALKTVMPSGIAVKNVKTVHLTDADIDCGRSRIKAAVLEKLKANDGILPYKSFKISEKRALADMCRQGAVQIRSSSERRVKSKFVKYVRLNISGAALDGEIAKLSKKAPVQAKLLNILSQTAEIKNTDLTAFSPGAVSALRALEKKGLILIEEKLQMRDAFNEDNYEKTTALSPTDEQRKVLNRLKKAVKEDSHDTFLLHGVTGSGKTEVFLQLIAEVLDRGKQAIVLVPEISLTPQMVERFVGRFGKKVSVLHSSLSLGERYDEWQKILNGEVSLAVGARSAVFAPFRNLGVIIMDEEQEPAYKSEAAPMYHARDVAARRAEKNNALLLLASATPSVESYYRAKTGEYKLLEMKKRYNNARLPKVEIVDMCNELRTGNKNVFSRYLYNEIDSNLRNKEQSILFLNRRGYNTFVSCRSCGESVKCRNCDVTMTYHKRAGKLMCHYCGYEAAMPDECPNCGSPYIRYFGDGTQKLEDELSKMYKDITYVRMDMDTTTNKNSHEAILNRFKNEHIDVLIGTQMVTKGLDFKDVTLVGVMAADLSLNMSDFRAYERTFSLLTQVCGRAGRGDVEGRAVIQTYQPDHFVIQLAKTHDYAGFYEQEIAIRERLRYPPFCDIIMILASGEDEDRVSFTLSEAVRLLMKECDLSDEPEEERSLITAPVPAPLSKINGKHRWRTLIKTSNIDAIYSGLQKMTERYGRLKDVTITVNVNPNSIL